MSDDQFTKLFKYIEKRFDKIDEQFAQNRQEHADVRAAIGELAAQVRDYHQKVLAMSHQIDRLR